MPSLAVKIALLLNLNLILPSNHHLFLEDQVVPDQLNLIQNNPIEDSDALTSGVIKQNGRTLI